MTPAEVFERKREFVQEYLAPMLHFATRGYVADLEYRVGEHGEFEFVKVVTEVGEGYSVNVALDSDWAIAKDVMRAVARKYE